MFIHDRLGRRKDATGAIVDLIRVASSSGMGSTHLIGHELGHNLMSIARDAGVITEAQQKELDALFTDKNGKFDEEAFAEAFARELKRAFFETVQKRMEDVPATKAGRALRRVADFVVTLARSFAFWRQERGLDPVTGQPLQAGQVLDAFLKRERTAEDEATQVANAARAAEARATQEAMAKAPTQTVVDEDGTEVAYHEAERGDKSNKKASELNSVPKHDGIGEDVLDALDVMLRTEGDTTIYTREFGDVLLPFGRFLNQVPGLKGKGFLHILEERTGKDNLSVPAAVEVFLRSVEAAVRGKEIRALNQENRYAIDLDGYRAIIADNGDSREFITGYKIFTEAEKKKREQEKKEKEEERSDVETDAIRQSANYDPARHGRLRQEGAERLRERIAQLLAGRQVPKSVEELAQELEDLDIAHYRLLNAQKKAEENGASQEELDALQKDIDENRAKSKQVAKAKKKLNQQRAKERKLYGDPNEERRDHIKVWSGAPQEFAVPSLAYVGSGTGGNNEGRGLYSSGVRGVAQDKYARGALRWWEPYVQTGRIIFDGKVFDNARRFFNSLGDSLAGTFYTGDGLKRTADGNYLADGVAYSEDVVLLYAIARGLSYSAFRSEEFYEFILFQGRSATNLKDDRIHKKTLEYANDIYDTLDDYKNPENREMAKFFADLVKTKLAKKKDWIAFWDSILKKAEPELVRTEDPPPAVMEQTWFTNRPEGDVSHLLNWFEAVTPEQMGWILDGARKAGFSEEEIAFLQRERIDDDDVLIEDGNRMPSGREMYMRLEAIAMMRDGRYGEMSFDAITTEELWKAHANVMGDIGRFASEFFVSADIDGMMYPVDYRHGNRDGRVSGWNYVAFSDEHLRVDHVYEYNPETDDFELKWHESEGGASLRFTETPLGQELVAEAFDAIVGSRVDLLLRPSRYYGNPYETRDLNPRNALVTEHLHRDVDVSEPSGFAAEVSAEISRFGTREGDPTLREIRARCGSKARFYEVLGAVYETAEAVRSGLADVVTGRKRAMMENAGLQAADFIKHNATARATALGRKLYLMGREFAWKLYQEDIAAARAEVERQRRKASEARGEARAAKAQTRNAERREETARNQAYQNRWGLAEERFMREYERALLRHQAARKVSDVREKMQEQVDLLRLREAKKRALERERGVTFTALKATLGVDIPARLRALAGTQEDPFEAAAKLIAEIDDGFDKWVKRDRRDLLDGTEPYTYLNEQGERAYAETMGNVLKAVARDLSYGTLREALLNAADKIARAKPEALRVIVEGKLGRVARVLRLAQNADIVTLARRRIKSALAEANKRLSSANSGMRTRYMTAMRKQAKELIKTMQLAVSAQDNTKASEKKRYAMLAERARLAEELKVIESGKTPDDLAKDETLTDRQHQDAVKLMFLEKFGDLSYTIDPAEVWAKAAEAEGFVVS